MFLQGTVLTGTSAIAHRAWAGVYQMAFLRGYRAANGSTSAAIAARPINAGPIMG